MKLFSVLTVVVDTWTYNGDKIVYNLIHTHKWEQGRNLGNLNKIGGFDHYLTHQSGKEALKDRVK